MVFGDVMVIVVIFFMLIFEVVMVFSKVLIGVVFGKVMVVDDIVGVFFILIEIYFV